jgi:hypothetical protein
MLIAPLEDLCRLAARLAGDRIAIQRLSREH